MSYDKEITADSASQRLMDARAVVDWYKELEELGIIDVQAHPDLARQAWVRAVILGELASPEEVEDRAGDVVLEYQQYVVGVYALAGAMRLPPVDFRAEIEKAMPVVDGVAEVDSGSETVATLAGKVCGIDLSKHLSVGQAWVCYSANEISPASEVFKDERLAYHPVYPDEFISAARSTAVTSDMVSLAVDADTGAFVLDSLGQAHAKEDLPAGRYVLRRGALTTVDRRKFLDAVCAITEVPGLMKKRGYCYLLAVPAYMRASVGKCAGPYPEVDELRRMLPNGGRWTDAEAAYEKRPAGYHLKTIGSLPKGIPRGAVLGADAVDEEVERELMDVIHRLDAQRKAREALSGESRSSAIIPRRLTGGGRLSLAVPAEVAGRVGFSRVDSVTVLPNPSDLFQDDPKHIKRGSALVQRLDGGGPVSDSYFRKADNRYNIGKYLPAVRSVTGRTVLLPDGAANPACTTGDWKNMDFAIGWRTMRLSLRKQKGSSNYDMVVGPGAAARLDCSAVGSVSMGAGVCVPGIATVVWFTGAVSFAVREPGGSVAVSVPASGSATGPGWLASTAVALYGCPYVHSHAEHNLADAELVVLKEVSRSRMGLVRTKGSVNVRKVGNVDLRISAEDERDGLGVFTVAGVGLRSLVVAGVVIQANSKREVQVAVSGWKTSMSANLSSPGKLKISADFVADPAVLENHLRPSPSSPIGEDFGFGSL